MGGEFPTVVLNVVKLLSMRIEKYQLVMSRLSSLLAVSPLIVRKFQTLHVNVLKKWRNVLFLMFATMFCYMRVYLCDRILPTTLYNLATRTKHLHPLQNFIQASQLTLIIVLSHVWAFYLLKKAWRILKRIYKNTKI